MGARMNGNSSCGTDHRCLEIAGGNRDRAARPERQLFVGLDVVAERHLRVGAAVDVIEDDTWKALFREPPKVADVEDVRGSYAARPSEGF